MLVELSEELLVLIDGQVMYVLTPNRSISSVSNKLDLLSNLSDTITIRALCL